MRCLEKSSSASLKGAGGLERSALMVPSRSASIFDAQLFRRRSGARPRPMPRTPARKCRTAGISGEFDKRRLCQTDGLGPLDNLSFHPASSASCSADPRLRDRQSCRVPLTVASNSAWISFTPAMFAR